MSEDIYLVAKAERERDRKLGRKVAGAGLATSLVAGGIPAGRATFKMTRAALNAPNARAAQEAVDQIGAKYAGSRAVRAGRRVARVGDAAIVGGGALGVRNMVLNRRERKAG